MKTERIHHVTVVSPDAVAARGTFLDLFALPPAAGTTPALAIGSARIEFVTPAGGSRLAAALAAGGEGMAAICLQVASVADAEARLRSAGVTFTREDTPEGPALHVDPLAAHGVRLTLRAAD
jgi:catechol 2,3-dioxygenase-like lactoylglutathione lyase family enzyme